MKITKEVFQKYLETKKKKDKYEKEEKSLKKDITEKIGEKITDKKTEKTLEKIFFKEYSVQKTFSLKGGGVDFEKFYDMYYDPENHTVIPKKEEKTQVSYKIRRV